MGKSKTKRKTFDKIETASQLWEFLESIAKFNKSGYDQELISELKKKLGLASNSSVQSGIQSKGITVRQLLAAFLESMEPYAVMQKDLLEMFKTANAQSGDTNIKIVIDIQKGKSLPIDLTHFEQDVTDSSEVIEKGNKLKSLDAKEEVLWKLEKTFELTPAQNKTIKSKEDDYIPEDVQAWLKKYEDWKMSGVFPGRIPTRWMYPDLDSDPAATRRLIECMDRISEMLSDIWLV